MSTLTTFFLNIFSWCIMVWCWCGFYFSALSFFFFISQIFIMYYVLCNVVVVRLYTVWFPCDTLCCSEFWTQWSLTLDKGCYCNPSRFQTRDPKLQKWMCLLFVSGELVFHLMLMGILFNEFLRKIHLKKMQSITM